MPATDPPEDETPPRPGSPPDRYRLGAELGRGGMGRVVEAFDLQLNRTVALKEVLPKGSGGGTVRRFEREVQLTARLEHPSIIPIYDSGTMPDGRPFYVMRRVSGLPFDELIARARGLDERLTLLPPLLAAIDAIAHAHRRGVIHRDLKPQNILVRDLSETVVIDWGLAKVLGEDSWSGETGDSVKARELEAGELEAGETLDLPAPGAEEPLASDSLKTQVGSVFGTPGFMSPEQARGEELGTRGDVFALGATLYQLLAGIPPHQGNSATEVIDKTARHDVRPLSEVAPGAPAELVAIVEKALAFDAAKRYPHAGALGEDVRRFLTGQLVAAHHYTPGQRVVRFAKRHRAPLGVAALALVAVAVLAWIGVARIIEERDAADTARAAAVAGQRAAEQARDELAERNDALVVAQARALLDQNPTEAVATLKTLSPRTPRAADARAIAQAAVMRGVAWAAENTAARTVQAELEPGGRRLLQVARDGEVRVWDLDLRRQILARSYPDPTRAMWVAGGRVLVIHGKTPPQLLDPVANTSESLSIDPIVSAVVSATGERVLFTTGAKGARLLEVADRSVKELDTEHAIDQLAIAPDGSWMALLDPKAGVRVVDASGKELTRREGEYYQPVASAARSLALLTTKGKVIECRLAGAPVWTEVPVPVQAPQRVVSIIYRGAELDMWATTGAIYTWRGVRAVQRLQLETITDRMYVAGDDTLIVPGLEGRVHFLNDSVHGTLRLPTPVPNHRLAARPGSSRLAVVGDGLVAGFDLAHVVPRSLPQPPGIMEAQFVDDRTLLARRGGHLEWKWMDAETGAATTFESEPRGDLRVTDTDPLTGRVLVYETGPTDRLLLFRKGSAEIKVIAEGQAPWGKLIAGDAIVYGIGDNRLFAQQGASPGREIAKLDGVVESIAALGPSRFAARGSSGELVRGDLSTGALERARAATGTRGFVASDRAGRLFVIEDRRLFAWDSAVIELATFDKPIAGLDAFEGGAAVHLAGAEVWVIDASPGARPVRVLAPNKGFARSSFDPKLLVGLGNARQLELVELPSRARWSLPLLFEAQDAPLAISPSARLVLQGTLYSFVIWTLPKAGPELGPWLDELTNASLDSGGVIAWPWQRARAP